MIDLFFSSNLFPINTAFTSGTASRHFWNQSYVVGNWFVGLMVVVVIVVVVVVIIIVVVVVVVVVVIVVVVEEGGRVRL